MEGRRNLYIEAGCKSRLYTDGRFQFPRVARVMAEVSRKALSPTQREESLLGFWSWLKKDENPVGCFLVAFGSCRSLEHGGGTKQVLIPALMF